MSTPSSPNDGQTGRKEFFRHGLNQQFHTPTQPLHQHQITLQQQSFVNSSNIALQHQAPILQQQASGLNTATAAAAGAPPPAPPQFLHWTNPLMGGAPAPATPTQQQHQQFNDFLFNIQAQAAYAAAAAAVPSPPQVGPPSNTQETFSVLPVGNGNFLKIYHCPENAMGPLSGETSFTPLAAYNQQQTAAFHHVNAQAANAPTTLQHQQTQQQQQQASNNSAANPQVFNSYELFSSNTFTQLPTAEMPPLLLLGPTTQPPILSEDFSNGEQNRNQLPQSNNDAKNMIIHNMPNNWAGNNPAPAPSYAQFEKRQNNDEFENPTHALTNVDSTTAMTASLANNNVMINDNLITNADLEKTLNANIAIQQQQQSQPHQTTSVKSSSTVLSSHKTLSSNSPVTLTKNTEIPRQEAPKKRIVAEVKPMRMTYSDVLSKFNNQTQNSQQQQNQNNLNNSSSNTAINFATNITASSNRQQLKSTKLDTSSINLRRNGDDITNTTSATLRSSSKKSPVHENKENQSQQQLINSKLNTSNQKRSSSSTTTNNGNNTINSLNINNNNMNNGSTTNKTSATIQKNLINNSKNNINNNINNNNNNNNTNDNQTSRKPRSNKNSDNIQNNGGEIFFSDYLHYRVASLPFGSRFNNVSFKNMSYSATL